MTIREFLNAQYDAEENAARIAAGQPMAAANVSRWHPRHVLADLASKRAIMREIETARAAVRAMPGGSARLAVMHGLDMMERHLLQPYADREGFDKRWQI